MLSVEDVGVPPSFQSETARGKWTGTEIKSTGQSPAHPSGHFLSLPSRSPIIPRPGPSVTPCFSHPGGCLVAQLFSGVSAAPAISYMNAGFVPVAPQTPRRERQLVSLRNSRCPAKGHFRHAVDTFNCAEFSKKRQEDEEAFLVSFKGREGNFCRWKGLRMSET